MFDPYDNMTELRVRYKDRLSRLDADDFDVITIELIRALRRREKRHGGNHCLEDTDDSQIISLVLPRLRRSSRPQLRKLDRHDLAEIVRFLVTAGYGRLAVVAVELISRPGRDHLINVPGTDLHLFLVRKEEWKYARERLSSGTATPQALRQARIEAMQDLCSTWGLDPIRAETYETLVLQSIDDAIAMSFPEWWSRS